jgi:RNA-directed DNA polymerase
LSVLAKLQSASSLHDVAGMLGYQPKALSYLIHKMPSGSKYVTFTVPKKSGGVRTINAPVDKLKNLQRRLSRVLYQCREEIDALNPRPPLSHGFRKAQSIITNAHPHIKRRYVLNLDLEDFFPSFNFGRVRGFFIKNKDFSLNPNVATIIAQIACHNNELPQGAPTSPIISDMLAHLLDVRLAQLAKKNACTYSRYADDLTFSTNLRVFPPALAIPSTTITSEWQLADPLVKTILGAGFVPNAAKTRMHFKTSRQNVTGLTVNRKVNIRADYYRTLRSMCHAMFAKGIYFCKGLPATTSVEIIGGMLSHVFYVKREVAHAREVDIVAEKSDHGVRRLYRRFLFFKRFVILDRPIIVCEGKTDNIYLKLAIRKFATAYPKLVSSVGGKLKSHVAFLNHTSTENDVLKLGGGVSGIKLLATDYTKYIKLFAHRPLLHPVILVIDNDTDDVIKIAKTGGKAITLLSSDPFYRLAENLYLVKTPELGPTGASCSEDLFDKSVLSTPVDGKKFNPAKQIDPAKEYGKIVLAEKVVRAGAATIDFSKFKMLLDRIVAVIDDYKPPVAPSGPALPPIPATIPVTP